MPRAARAVRAGAVPSGLFFLTALFGGGQLTRAIHPWIGVVLFFSFVGLFLRFWQANLWKARGRYVDGAPARRADGDDEESLPEVGKYNAGQKLVFWSMSILILVLFCSGIVIWDEYFDAITTIDRPEALRRADPRAGGGGDHLRLDRARLRGDLGARHDRRHDARPGHRRLGLAASSQMAAGTGDGKR